MALRELYVARENDRSTVEKYIPRVLQNLSDQEVIVRRAAVDVLRKTGVRGDEAVRTLLRGLQDQDELVRVDTLLALGQSKINTVPVVPALLKALHDSSLTVRAGAANLLGDLGKTAPAAVPSLLTMFRRETDNYARFCAVKALGKIGPPARSALPSLREALATTEGQLKESLLEAISKIEGKP
jgi:HEAT repeat protein